jgi:hypothetical protein
VTPKPFEQFIYTLKNESREGKTGPAKGKGIRGRERGIELVKEGEYG